MIRSILAALALTATPALAQEAGSHEPIECPLPLIWEGEVEGETFSCGVVHVPENHDVPEGKLIELVYIKMHADTLSPAPDPLIYLSGGPGGTAQHELATNQVLHMNMQGIRQRRDVIFYDQRGTGHSHLLACGPFNAAIGVVGETVDLPGLEIETLEALSAGESTGLLITLAACGTGLQSAGVDLAQYNSVASAKDIVMIADALGYEDYNLYGTSYGTRLSLNALRSTPDRIRSVVLDGTVTPDKRGTAETTAKTYEHYEALFRLCGEDDYCSEQFPNAREEFIAVLDQLSTDPMVFDPPIVPSSFVRRRFSTIEVIDPKFFADFALLNNGGLQAGLAAALPILVQAIAAGDEDRVRDILGRGEASEVTEVATGDGITADDRFIAPPLNLILSRAAATAEANAAGGLNQEWMSVVIGEMAERLAAGEAQAEVVRDAVELSFVPFEGTNPDALIAYAETHLSADAARTANALVGAMDRKEVRETMWAIQDMAERMSPGAERSGGLPVSLAILFTINCAEEITFTPPEFAQAEAENTPFPGVLTNSVEGYRATYAACDFFPTPFEEDEMLAPVVSETPAMIFQQAMDTQTVISWGQDAAETLPNSFLLEWNSEGHVIAARSTDGCAGAIAAAFLDDPNREPDSTCASAEQYQLPFKFLGDLFAKQE